MIAQVNADFYQVKGSSYFFQSSSQEFSHKHCLLFGAAATEECIVQVS